VRPQTEVFERILAVRRDNGAAGAGFAVLISSRHQIVDGLQLVRLIFEQIAGLIGADDPVPERVVGLDDPAHARLYRREVLGRKRTGQVEVVVEAVREPVVGRSPTQPGLREHLLDGLRHHVGRGMA
jgi:hypothetical protein